MTSRCAEIRRCRPLLGTFVEVAARAESPERASAALEAAFAAVARVQRLMSFHDPASDVSRINRDAAREAVEVDAWTVRVLEAARDLHARTRGVFDVAVAPWLQRWGYLPDTPSWRAPARRTDEESAFELGPGRRVRFRRAAAIDLGGIAKGFAVDRAVEALIGEGAASCVVNAGGDLRVFGSEPVALHVRHPREPGRLLPLGTLRDAAFATSADTFTRRRWRGRAVSPLVDPRRGRACAPACGASVRAPTCLVADALTKVVMILGRRSAPILREHAASGFLISADGDIRACEAA